MTIAVVILAVLLIASIASHLHDLRYLARRCREEERHLAPFNTTAPLSRRHLSPFRSVFSEALNGLETHMRSDFESRTRYKILTDNLAAAVIIHESDGHIDWCSPYTEVLTGFARSEMYGDRGSFFLDHVHDDDRELVTRAFAIVNTGEPFQCRCRFHHRSGMVLWLEMRTVPIYNPEESDFTALSVMFDVTTSVNNQLQIEERNRDLHEFTYMLSHDLKAPIFTIKGMLGIIHEDNLVEQAPGLREPLEYIGKATHRLEDLVGGVLELAKISAVERATEPVSLDSVLHAVCEDFGKQLKDAGGEIQIPTDLPRVLGKERYLYQIFGNLVGNAIKYRLPNCPLAIRIEHTPHRSPRKILISVRDNGRGIPADKLPQIFKPFQRIGEENIEGTGIGLASVKRLCEKLGAEISVESSPGAGTTFTIELRVAAPQKP